MNVQISLNLRRYWRDTPRTGDVVLFHYPIAVSAEDSEAARPCLVIDANREHVGENVLIACSSAGRHAAFRGYDIYVSKRAELRKAGLRKPICFVGALRMSARLDSPFFASSLNGSPIMGRLTGSALGKPECDAQSEQSRRFCKAVVAVRRQKNQDNGKRYDT